MIAAHLDNYLFLLFIAVWIFFQLLTRVATKSGRRTGDDPKRRSTPPQTPRSISGQPEETDEDRIRKFLEALGQPTASKPPPPVARRPTYQKPVVLPHVGPFSSPLPPLTTRPPDLPPAFKVHQGPSPLEAIPSAEVKAASQPATQAAAKPRDLAGLLRTTSGLRDAIILREIFGPPRSLQPLDLVGSV